MTPEMQKYIELLESQLGYAEKSGAYTKFGNWYGKNVEFDADYSSAPWCDMYLSWAAHKLGYEDWIGQFAWTVSHAEWFKEQGAWGHKPKPGAFVFYDWSGSNSIDNIDHVGIVTRVEGDTIFTIEGNIDGGVAKRKERDTSKVVGYGYPERIKSRLDEEAARQQREAQKKAEEQAALQPGPGTDVGALQQLSGNDLLTSLIPHSEIQEPARAPETGSSPAKKEPQAAPTPASPKVATGSAADSTTAESPKQPKKAKHAKPATADTTAATAEPIPTHADASATGPMPAISSPALVGSALVAALALLAVAKTRRLRAAPVTAGATTPGPAANRRRRRRKLEVEPVRTSRRTAALQPAATLDPVTATAALEAAALEAFRPAAALDTAVLAPAARDALQPATALDALQPVTALEAVQPAARATGRRRRPLDTRPFDLATDTDPFDAFFASRPAEPARSGPVEILVDTGPLERFVDTGPFERIVIPQATSAFDAFSPTDGRGDDVFDIGATYQGRRRRLGRSGDEPGTADLPLRGRRHRRPAPTQGVHIGGAQPFAQDAPLAGRRHASAGSPQPHRREDERQLVGAGGTGRGASSHPARSGPSQPGRSAPGQPGRSTTGQPRRRGRHRA
ncbi:CHAP domain-containing protein [Nonomuraea sp. NPDC003709]|uniref:CHAP domain-containing protein n=1 Tax=Nonomuraea sp. NPDC003709 TaxID=3154450 RepID=UPI0033A11223